jgi:hypothetical protein
VAEAGQPGAGVTDRSTRQTPERTGSRLSVIGLGLLFVCSVLILAFQCNTRGSNIHNCDQARWRGIVTLTAVTAIGFPVTRGGPGAVVVLTIARIGLLGILTATVASYFIAGGEDKAPEGADAIASDFPREFRSIARNLRAATTT